MHDEDGQQVPLAAPVILDRSRHPISRRNIDPDALKVLYRLQRHGFTAYLVGGAVRDLMLGRTPQDFDVGTNARPRQVKKLFRNAYLIGRRFRLAQVRFHGGKVIEVATFRRDPQPGEPEEAVEDAEVEEAAGETKMDAVGGGEDDVREEAEGAGEAGEGERRPGRRPPLPPIAYGTPREDAFRRDITINALFYDIATFSVIDYVGGLDDLGQRRIRVIGPPERRYEEDPVRMWRVLRHAARLGFSVEEHTERAIEDRRGLLAGCSGARLYEELNKDLKSGSFRPLVEGLRRHSFLSILFGRPGEFFQGSVEAWRRLEARLGQLDSSVSAGTPLSPSETYGLLFQDWAEHLLEGFSGDRVKHLHDAFGSAGMAMTLPRALTAELVQTLVILDRMLWSLRTGRLRGSLNKRARYADASRLCGLLTEGRLSNDKDPFEILFRRRYDTFPEHGEKRRRRRRRKTRKPAPGAPRTE